MHSAAGLRIPQDCGGLARDAQGPRLEVVETADAALVRRSDGKMQVFLSNDPEPSAETGAESLARDLFVRKILNHLN